MLDKNVDPFSARNAAQAGLTGVLAERAAALRPHSVSVAAVRAAKQCLLDYLAVSIVGAAEPVARFVRAELEEQGGKPVATVLGCPGKLPSLSAALANGAAAHALDYDDVSMAMPGHPSAPILPAVLAAAEEAESSGSAILTAFIAGYDLAARLGLAVAPDHYDGIGFHSTGTVGSFGAAAAVSNLLGLDAATTAVALGIAGTQASGLRSMFGTMCKPFHAGKAAQNGLLGVKLARRGMTSRSDVMECDQGFADTQSADWHPERARENPEGGFHVLSTLFKYHASCYGTHGVIGAAYALKERHGISAEQIASIAVRVEAAYDRVCNIAEPHTGLQAKFSLTHTIAMAFVGRDLSQPASFADNLVPDQALVDLRRKVSVGLDAGRATRADMEVVLTNGRRLAAAYDSGVPEHDLDRQQLRIERKFTSLVEPIWGAWRTARVVDVVGRLENLASGDLSEALQVAA